MRAALLLLGYIPVAFSALLPVINPIGSAVIFLGLVDDIDHGARKRLARGIAISTVLFLSIVFLVGTTILHFFGVSLPIVQIGGGFVLATMGWATLNKPDAAPETQPNAIAASANVKNRMFYPLTFPLTAGPGCIVVAITLSAHASRPTMLETILAHVGVIAGIALIGIVVYYCYAYADKTTSRIPASITQGILRVVSFILFCIGGEIMWGGIQHLMKLGS